ncbi:MAG TPA: DUF3800 domain-containing protein [Gemmataceae bacterium]|nr:DUF3800 domain-containing protein [Gemmataceae bacterium]
MDMRKPDRPYTRSYDEEVARSQLCSGNHYGIFIDDTGSPGMPSTPAKLHPERKSWVAVVVPPERIRALSEEFAEVIEALRSDLGMSEYHFAEIWSGKGPFRAVPMDERLVIFQMFADILYIHELLIYIQTFDPETHGAAITGWPELPKIAECFDLQCHEDAALWFLLVRVRDHILAERSSGHQRAMVVLDEGVRKSAYSVEIDILDDVFLDGLLLFASSSTAPLLQLADFAAFCLNRSQIIIRKEKRSDIEIALLRILEPLVPQYKNCSPKLGWAANTGPMIP